jgi:hypothetical protein
MNTILKAATCVIFASFASAAAAECNDAVIGEKVEVISAEMETLATTSPELVEEYSERLKTLAMTAQSQEEICTGMDEILAEMTS